MNGWPGKVANWKARLRSIVTDHYLLDLYNTEILERGIMGPANKSAKLQAASNA